MYEFFADTENEENLMDNSHIVSEGYTIHFRMTR